MTLFESILMLMLLAIPLLRMSRRLQAPYPTILAMAGLMVALLPWAPQLSIDPTLVMALFIAPAILDAAFEFPLRAVRRYWPSLLSLAVVAVLLTTAAVAWVGVTFAGLPLAAAVVLGAIVAPPDAAASAAVLDRPSLPRATVTVLRGESLLNDAVALLIFSVALRMVGHGGGIQEELPRLAMAIPGGLLLGVVAGRLIVFAMPRLAGTLGGILFQFVITFGTWIAAERLELSAILAVAAAAMTVARHKGLLAARDRLPSDVVWSVVVFMLNVLAFLLIGLQARNIVMAFDQGHLRHAIQFALLVLATVIVVRVAWVMLYNRLVQPLYRWLGRGPGPTLSQGILASWCGMRGMVTLGAALALPAGFPQRDLVLLSALAVVLGTLVVQGLTLAPLIWMLRFPADSSLRTEIQQARLRLLAVAETQVTGREDAAACVLRSELALSRTANSVDALRLDTIRAERVELRRMLADGAIDDETYRAFEQELDLSEVAVTRRESLYLRDG